MEAKRASSGLYRPLIRLVIALVIFSVINWIITSIPVIRGLVIPGVISAAGIIDAITGVIMITSFLRFRRDFSARLRAAFPALPQFETLISAATNFGIILVSYAMLGGVIIPLIRGFSWAYQVVFLLAALPFLYSLIVNLYRSSDIIADLLTGKLAATAEPAKCSQGGLTEQRSTGWKDYYKILGVQPNSRPAAIRAAFKQLALLLSGNPKSGTPEVTVCSERMAEVKEAHDILSDPVRRRAYDKVFEARHDSLKEENHGGHHAQKVGNWKRWTILGKINVSSRAMRVAGICFVALLLVFIAGTSFAFAHPSQALAAPFRSIAMKVAEASTGPIVLIEQVRGIVATYERNIVSTAVQSMRTEDNLRVVPAVTVPTNDMSSFPSPEHPLFPDYLDKRYTEFRYTVDSKGIVQVDKSTATTDAFLTKINEALSQLKEAQ